MEYKYLRSRPNFAKQLTKSDVNDRLVVTTKMASMMPPAEPGRGTPIRVLDDQGDFYQFNLSGRKGESLKPFFKRKDWRAFIRKRGAKAGDFIYFWREVSEIKGTEYRIDVISFIDAVCAHLEDLGSSNQPSPEGTLALETWAAEGLAL